MARFKTRGLGLVTVLALAIGFATLAFWQDRPLTVQAAQEGSIYIVEGGDSLVSIANKLGVNAEALASTNGLAVNAQLYRGLKLLIPTTNSMNDVAQDAQAASEDAPAAELQQAATPAPTEEVTEPEATATVAEEAPVAAAAEPAAAPSALRTYRVQAGDSLFSIAKRFRIPRDALAAANNLDPNAILLRGLPLIIPDTGTTPAASAAAVPPPSAPEATDEAGAEAAPEATEAMVEEEATPTPAEEAMEEEATPEATEEMTEEAMEEEASAAATAEVTEEATPEATEAMVEEATPEATEEMAEETTLAPPSEMTEEEATEEEATVEEATEEEATAEPTEEMAEEATPEATEEMMEEEATPEATEEMTEEEATPEPTEEMTEEPTAEPTAEPTEEMTEEPTAEPTEEMVEEANLLDTITEMGNFTVLLEALEAAGLSETLTTDGPFTLFAPTDEAFEALPEGTIDGLLASSPDDLSQILLYHLVPGEILSSDFVDGVTVITAQGGTITLGVTAGGLAVNDALITISDIETSNGVIHVIDAVLLPSAGMAAAPPSAAATPQLEAASMDAASVIIAPIPVEDMVEAAREWPAPEESITLLSPVAGGGYHSPLTIIGLAQTYGGHVVINLTVPDDTVLAQRLTLGGEDAYGFFQTSLRFHVNEATEATLSVHEVDMAEGIMLHTIETRLTLLPGQSVLDVNSPVVGARVCDPILVSGYSNTFEANVVLSLITPEGDLLTQLPTLGGTMGFYRDFATELPYPTDGTSDEITGAATPLLISLAETDASGLLETIDETVIPVTLYPANNANCG